MGKYTSERVSEHLAGGGEFLVLTFTKSKSELRDIDTSRAVRVKTREHWFFKVESSKRITYRPYNAGQAVAGFKQQTGGSPDPYLESDEGVGPVRLIDQNGNDILRNDDDPWYVYHIATVPLQGDIRVYPQIPDSQPGGVFKYLSNNRPAAAAGDPVGYTSGDDHPSFYDPQTGLATTLTWETGIQSQLTYQFYNENQNRRKIPKLNIYGAGYVLTPITNEAVQRNLLNAASLGHESVTHVDWGPIRESFSYEVPDEWDDTGNYIEETAPSIPEEFQLPGGGELESIDELDMAQSEIGNMTDTELAQAIRGVVNNG